MSASSFSSISTTHGACRKEFKRQKTYLIQEKEYIIENESTDPLPIVELKPFVRKEWRREKSLPSFYDMLPPSKPLINRRKRDKELINSFEPTPPEKVDFCVGNGPNEQKPESKSHLNGHLSPRCRSKVHIHPQAETITPKQIEHSESLVPGFITRDERSKTTLNEIQHSDSPTKIHTGFMDTYERKETDEPSMCINMRGASFKRNGTVRRPLSYFVPNRNSMKKNGIWQQLQSTESLPHYFKRQHINQTPSDISARTPSPYYDSFDKNGALPSIKVSYKTLNKRVTKAKGVEFDEFHYTHDMYYPYHQIRKITNSFQELESKPEYGHASKIEKHLTFQLKIDLRNYRKSRDYFPFDITPNELAKYYPPPAINLTNGELQLRKAQQMNTPKKRRIHRERTNITLENTPEKLEDQDWPIPSRTEDERVIDTRNTNLESALENIDESESEDELKIKTNEITVPSQFDNVTTNTQDTESVLHESALQMDPQTTFTQPTKSTIDIGLQSTFPTEAPPIQDMETETMEHNQRSALSTRTSDIISGVRDANISFLDASDIQKDSEAREAANENENIDKLERDSTFLTSELNADYGNKDVES